MRLVEVVVLMGAHCVSPVEHSPMMTEAGKVQCAVVIEKDTDKNTIRVTPETAARDPKVAAAIASFGVPGGTRIVPAFAPAGSPTSETKLPQASPKPDTAQVSATVQPIAPPLANDNGSTAEAQPPVEAEAQQTNAAPSVPPDEQPSERRSVAVADASDPQPDAKPAPAAKPAAKQAQVATKPQPPRKQVASADPPTKQSGQCKGAAVPKWYTASDGHRKFRCVRPVPTSDKPVPQLY